MPSGVIGSRMRTNPYVPIFSITPASSTDPTVGAAVCASGSQLCRGHIGVFTARPRPMASTARSWVVWDSSRPLSEASATMSKVPLSSPISSRPSSMTTDPRRV